MARLAEFNLPEVGPFNVGASEIRQAQLDSHEAGGPKIVTTGIGMT